MTLTMENSCQWNKAQPKIFIKKINIDKTKTIPLKTPNNLGHIRYFPAATKEWSSSIYVHYNNNHIKSLPVLDKNIVKLIKGYFNFYHKSDNFKFEYISKRLLLRLRRLTLNKIFVSKAELEHTNSKVIINIHVYNIQKRLLMYECFFLSMYNKMLKKSFKIEFEMCNNQVNKEKIKEDKEKIKSKYKDLFDGVDILYSHYFNLMKFQVLSKFGHLKDYLKMMYLLKERGLSKQDRLDGKPYIPKLLEIFGKIYRKKVEINIVILKYMYLNSDILTQAIALKLKDRDNRVWRVLRSCLGMVKIPYTNKFKERSKANRAESLVDKIKNLDLAYYTSYTKKAKRSPSLDPAYFYSPFTRGTMQAKDSLNRLIFGCLPIMPEGQYEGWDFFSKKVLKYKAISGVRLEAKGRLTRRFTASRSVFKLTWKGGLKNIDSSYKGLSAAILRGHVRSNVQYTFIKSKNRIGAYGVKGWVSGK